MVIYKCKNNLKELLTRAAPVIIFKCVITRFVMLLYNTVSIPLKQLFGLYENQFAYFYCKLVVWFYIGRRLNVLMKVIQCF